MKKKKLKKGSYKCGLLRIDIDEKGKILRTFFENPYLGNPFDHELYVGPCEINGDFLILKKSRHVKGNALKKMGFQPLRQDLVKTEDVLQWKKETAKLPKWTHTKYLVDESDLIESKG